MVLAHIVPALPPPANGVGDYATTVARALKAAFSIDSVFIVGTPGSRVCAIDGEFSVHSVPERSSHAVLETLAQATGARFALLQLSPYGYEENGCPFWLGRGLRNWVAGDPAQRRLMTMFHELYASGLPWTRAFWVSWLQRRATRRILATSAFAMTGVRKFAEQLESWEPERRGAVGCLPIPSSMGEPDRVVPFARRGARICVFGLRAGRASLPSPAAQMLKHLIGRWAVEEIAVVGDSPVPGTFDGLGCAVKAYAGLGPQDVSRVLSDSILGLSWYPPEVLAKSSVFAAYCAHGIPALVLTPSGREAPSADGLEAGEHYLAGETVGEGLEMETLQRVSENARAWYAGHRVAEHARAIATYVRAQE